MATFATGEIVLVRFPFSDLKGSKLRPALVLAQAGRGDWLLCQITSQTYGDSRHVQLNDADFVSGSLRLISFARPAKLFTAHVSLMAQSIGHLKSEKFSAIRDAVVQLIKTGGAA